MTDQPQPVPYVNDGTGNITYASPAVLQDGRNLTRDRGAASNNPAIGHAVVACDEDLVESLREFLELEEITRAIVFPIEPDERVRCNHGPAVWIIGRIETT